MSLRKLLKLKAEFDAFDLKMQQRDLERQQIKLELQQQELDLLSFWFEMRKAAKQPLVSPEVDQSHEDYKVCNAREEEKKACVEDVQEDEGKEANFDLPPKFDEDELDEGEMLLLESNWDPKEEAKQSENISHSKPTVQGMICSLIIHGERVVLTMFHLAKLNSMLQPTHTLTIFSNSTHHKHVPTISLLVVSHLKKPLTI